MVLFDRPAFGWAAAWISSCVMSTPTKHSRKPLIGSGKVRLFMIVSTSVNKNQIASITTILISAKGNALSCQAQMNSSWSLIGFQELSGLNSGDSEKLPRWNFILSILFFVWWNWKVFTDSLYLYQILIMRLTVESQVVGFIFMWDETHPVYCAGLEQPGAHIGFAVAGEWLSEHHACADVDQPSLGRVLSPQWGGYIYEINVVFPFYSGALTLLTLLVVSFIRVGEKKLFKL